MVADDNLGRGKSSRVAKTKLRLPNDNDYTSDVIYASEIYWQGATAGKFGSYCGQSNKDIKLMDYHNQKQRLPQLEE